MNDLAPIVLFGYNRPLHTLKTLTALKNNILADQSKLFIFLDGQKTTTDQLQKDNFSQLRKVVTQEKWCKEVTVIERPTNFGLAKNIVSGVTEVINKYGKVIVLEDDIVTSPYFLKFMNDALRLYEKKKKVMHIGGYFPKTDYPEPLNDTVLLNFMLCWGWATWKDRWDKLQVDPATILNKIVDTKKLKEFDVDGTYQAHIQLQSNIEGILNTWAVKWYGSIFLNNGLCLYPTKSLCRNIGIDGSGINFNSKIISKKNKNILQKKDINENEVLIKIDKLEQNKQGLNYLKHYYTYGQKKNFRSIIKKYKKRLIQTLMLIPLWQN